MDSPELDLKTRVIANMPYPKVKNSRTNQATVMHVANTGCPCVTIRELKAEHKDGNNMDEISEIENVCCVWGCVSYRILQHDNG